MVNVLGKITAYLLKKTTYVTPNQNTTKSCTSTITKLSTYHMPKYWGCVVYCHFIGLGWGNVFNWKYVQKKKLCDLITILWIILSSAYEILSGKEWQLKWRWLVLLNHVDSVLRILRKINWAHFVAFKNYVGRHNKNKIPEHFSSISSLRCESTWAALLRLHRLPGAILSLAASVILCRVTLPRALLWRLTWGGGLPSHLWRQALNAPSGALFATVTIVGNKIFKTNCGKRLSYCYPL